MDPRLLNPLIHIGYHKTGSTWIQKHLFDCPERGFFRLAAMAKSNNRSAVSPAKRFSKNFIHKPNEKFYSLGEFFPEKMRELLAECKLMKSGVPVLSQERLSGHPDTGGFDSEDICVRLSQVFDSPKIFIVIREQKSLISACYIDYLVMGGTKSLHDYMNPACYRSPRFRKRFFMFHHLISMYQEVFGKENVLVLPYEMFRDEPAIYFQKLGSFSGVVIPDSLPVNYKVNVRVNTFLESKLRYLNWFVKRGSLYERYPFYMGKSVKKFARSMKRKLGEVLPAAIENREKARHKYDIEQQVGDLYRESNLKSSELIGIDLVKYNY